MVGEKTSGNTKRIMNALLDNSRFWILASGIAAAFIIAGIIQLLSQAGSAQAIQIEQIYGFVSFFLLYVAVLASPLTKVFPNSPFNKQYLHARRAIGVLAFLFAFLHVYITFFYQLNGFNGLGYFDTRYNVSLLLGLIALVILLIMTMTSLDIAIRLMHFKNWKLLHRLVYLAGIAILIHVAIIGPHYTSVTFLGILTYICIAFLLALEAVRFKRSRAQLPKKATV